MIDWLSWPLAQHVETWVIALLKGLAAVQKFTILIDVTLLKIELVCWKRAFKTEGEGKELLTPMQLCSIFFIATCSIFLFCKYDVNAFVAVACM